MTGGFGGSMGGAQGGKGKRPISVKFEIPYFTTSGIQVRYLKIIEPKVSRARTFLTVFSNLQACVFMGPRRHWPGDGHATSAIVVVIDLDLHASRWVHAWEPIRKSTTGRIDVLAETPKSGFSSQPVCASSDILTNRLV